jgi:copper resistance protein C
MKLIALAAAAALIATPAFAHAHLLQETPADKAVVSTAPSVLILRFSEGVELAFTGVVVIGPDRKTVPLGKASLAPNNDKILSVPLPGALGAGAYTVDWHALSTDGHKTHGAYGFTVK